MGYDRHYSISAEGVFINGVLVVGLRSNQRALRCADSVKFVIRPVLIGVHWCPHGLLSHLEYTIELRWKQAYITGVDKSLFSCWCKRWTDNWDSKTFFAFNTFQRLE